MKKAPLAARAVAAVVDFALVALLLEWGGVGYWLGLLFVLCRDGFLGGQSPGKKLMQLVVMKTGTGSSEPGGVRESMLRNLPFGLAYLAGAVPLIGWLLAAAVCVIEGLLVVGNEDGSRLGDQLAKTLVMEETRDVSE